MLETHGDEALDEEQLAALYEQTKAHLQAHTSGRYRRGAVFPEERKAVCITRATTAISLLIVLLLPTQTCASGMSTTLQQCLAHGKFDLLDP